MNPYLRDGVDVYIEENQDSSSISVTFVFLSTRKRLQVNSDPVLVKSLSLMDGENTISAIADIIGVHRDKVLNFVQYLTDKNVVTDHDWFYNLPLDDTYKNRMKKQIYFLMDILPSWEKVLEIQTKIRNSRIAIFGIGSTGSWLMVELLQMGFETLKLYDFKKINCDSVARHAFHTNHDIGRFKVDKYRDLAKQINPDVSILAKVISINTQTDLESELDDIDIVINCADEPYIGYTSIFLSRYCISKNKKLFVAGGFDAHLGCLGEMIIPHKTPCSDCYNSYFKESLKNWKPIKHPVNNRTKGFGGLPTLSVFSASTAALSILRLFINEDELVKNAGGRGEFKFNDYSIDAFEVRRNDDCEVCGAK